MSRYTNILALAAAAMVTGATGVQAQVETDTPAILATYYECDYALEGTADIMMRRLAPVYQKHVDAGHLTGFNMAAHVMGGAWRRFVTITGARDAVLDVWTTLDAEMQAADPVAYAQFIATCGSHQDYLWNQIAASPAPATPPAANQFRLSTYFFCNQAQEESVDSLVTKTIGPEIQKHVAMGHLTSWGWLRHANGGTVRRVLTYTGPSVKALFQMREAIMSGVGEEAADGLYAGGCGNHFEYVWADVTLTP